MDINLNVGAKGIVNIKRIRDGVVQEEHTFHNLIIEKHFFSIPVGGAVIKVGSGSTPPTQSDTALESYIAGGLDNTVTTMPTDDTLATEYTWTWGTGTGTAGTVCEISLWHTYISMVTRALVTDAEGSPISIVKTEYDELAISYTITFTYNKPLVLCKSTTIPSAYVSLAATIGYSPAYVKAIWFQYQVGGRSSSGASQKVTNNVGVTTLEYTTSDTPGYINSINTGYYTSYRYWYDYGALMIPFPNTDIFPVRTLTGYSLGTGDGTTTDFAPAMPWWLENTEKVYKNGILLTRDVDYLVDNFHALVNGKGAIGVSYFSPNIAQYATSLTGYIYKAYYEDTGEDIVTQVYNGAVGNKNYNSFRNVILQIATDNAPNLTIDTVYISNYRNYYYSYSYYSFNCDISFSNDNGNTWTTIKRPGKKTARGNTGYANLEAYEAGTVGGYGNYLFKLDTPIAGVTHIKFSKYADFTLDSYITEDNTYTGFFDQRIYIGHIGDYAIRFIDPPAEGDVLTMDCDIDRPWIGGKEVCNTTITTTLSNV